MSLNFRNYIVPSRPNNVIEKQPSQSSSGLFSNSKNYSRESPVQILGQKHKHRKINMRPLKLIKDQAVRSLQEICIYQEKHAIGNAIAAGGAKSKAKKESKSTKLKKKKI
jgi:hypothetical protein